MITCEFEDGKKASLRHVTVDALAIKGGKILMVRRAENLVHGGKLAFPGGFLDRNETPEQAVIRELREETGYSGKVRRLVTILADPNRDDRQNVSFCFEVEVTGQEAQPDREVSEVVWIQPSQLPAESEFAFDHFALLRKYLQEMK